MSKEAQKSNGASVKWTKPSDKKVGTAGGVFNKLQWSGEGERPTK